MATTFDEADRIGPKPGQGLGWWSRERLESELFDKYPEAEHELTDQVIQQYRRDELGWDYLRRPSRQGLLPGKVHPKPADCVALVQKWTATLKHHHEAARDETQRTQADAEVASPLDLMERILRSLTRVPEQAGHDQPSDITALTETPDDIQALETSLRQHYPPGLASDWLEATAVARSRLVDLISAWDAHLHREAGRVPPDREQITIEQWDAAYHRQTITLAKILGPSLERLDKAIQAADWREASAVIESVEARCAHLDVDGWSTPAGSNSSSSSSSSGGEGGDGDSDLSDTANQILEVLDEEEWTSRQELAGIVDVAPRTITVRAQELREHGRIQEDTQGGEKVYRLR